MSGANVTADFGITMKTRDGQSVAFACGPDERMLDAAGRQDLYPPPPSAGREAAAPASPTS
jgi:hypothetical protein